MLFWSTLDKVLENFFQEMDENTSFKLSKLAEAMNDKGCFRPGLYDQSKNYIQTISNHLKKLSIALYDQEGQAAPRKRNYKGATKVDSEVKEEEK